MSGEISQVVDLVRKGEGSILVDSIGTFRETPLSPDEEIPDLRKHRLALIKTQDGLVILAEQDQENNWLNLHRLDGEAPHIFGHTPRMDLELSPETNKFLIHYIQGPGDDEPTAIIRPEMPDVDTFKQDFQQLEVDSLYLLDIAAETNEWMLGPGDLLDLGEVKPGLYEMKDYKGRMARLGIGKMVITTQLTEGISKQIMLDADKRNYPLPESNIRLLESLELPGWGGIDLRRYFDYIKLLTDSKIPASMVALTPGPGIELAEYNPELDAREIPRMIIGVMVWTKPDLETRSYQAAEIRYPIQPLPSMLKRL